MTKPKRKKLPTIPSLVKKADRVFSEYVRRRDTTQYIEDENGMSIRAGHCVTCNRLVPTEGKGTGHAGHFVERGIKLTRYDPRNVHLQCNYCNTYKYGEQYKHSVYIKVHYGQEVVDELTALEALYKSEGHKFTRDELMGVITTYSAKIVELGTM